MRKCELKTACSVKLGKNIWMSGFSFNGLFRLDTESGKSYFVDLFPNESIDIRCAHIKALSYGDLVVFIPWNASHIHIYNITDGTFTSIRVEKKYAEHAAGAVIFEGVLYVMPYYPMHDLVKVDLRGLEAGVVSDFSDQDFKLTGIGGTHARVNNVVLHEGCIWYAFQETDKIYKWDIKTHELSEYMIGGNIWSIFDANDGLWIVDRKSSALRRWTYEDSAIYFIDDIKETSPQYDAYYYIIRGFFENTAVFSIDMKTIYFLKGDNKTEQKTIDEVEILDTRRYLSLYVTGEIVNDQLWLLPCGGKDILIFARNMEMVEKKESIVEGEECDKLWKKWAGIGYGCLREGDFQRLSDFVECVANL